MNFTVNIRRNGKGWGLTLSDCPQEVAERLENQIRILLTAASARIAESRNREIQELEEMAAREA